MDDEQSQSYTQVMHMFQNTVETVQSSATQETVAGMLPRNVLAGQSLQACSASQESSLYLSY